MGADDLDSRLRDLERKAMVRRIWVDTARKWAPGLAFMIAGACLVAATDNRAIEIGGMLLILGGWLMMV